MRYNEHKQVQPNEAGSRLLRDRNIGHPGKNPDNVSGFNYDISCKHVIPTRIPQCVGIQFLRLVVSRNCVIFDAEKQMERP